MKQTPTVEQLHLSIEHLEEQLAELRQRNEQLSTSLRIILDVVRAYKDSPPSTLAAIENEAYMTLHPHRIRR